MKSLLTVLLVLSLSLSLTACGARGEKSPSPPSAAPTTTATVTTSTTATLTADEAKAAALAHAAVDAGDALFTKEQYERDDGVPHYDFVFQAGGNVYEYEIHAQSGAVLEYQKHRATTVSPSGTTATMNPVPTLSPDRAKEIAFEHAKVTADKVYDLSVEFERERGTPTYEVEFNVERTEHHYTIHADTGEILHTHTERD